MRRQLVGDAGAGGEVDLRSDDTALASLLAILSPAGAERDIAHSGRSTYAVLPGSDHPRHLVPVRRQLAWATRFRPSPSAGRNLAIATLRHALGMGAGRVFPYRVCVPHGTEDDPSLASWLAGRLDEPAVEVAVALGAPRANRKPVLQVMRLDGTTVCYAKVAVNAHTDALVAAEASFLAGLQPTERLRTPELLFVDHWRGHPVAAIADLNPKLDTNQLELDQGLLLDIAGLIGIEEHPVVDSPWWRSIEQRALGLNVADEARPVLRALAARVDGTRWRFGAWHGDFAPWNASWEGSRLVLWDWERAGGPVPLGLDAIHTSFQVSLLRHGTPVGQAAQRAATEQAQLLSSLGLPRGQLGPIVDAYLLELWLRWLDDARYGPLGISVAAPADVIAAAAAGTPTPVGDPL